MKKIDEIWDAVIKSLYKTESENAVNMFIKPTTALGYEDDTFIIKADDEFQKDIIMSKYKVAIRNALNEITGLEMDVKAVTEPVIKKNPEENGEKDFFKTSTDNKNITSEYTFENFIVGDSNKHAHACAVAVAENPATTFNPFFIYGNTGLGKTHLLNAIKNRIMTYFPDYKVVYMTCEAFTNDFVDHLQRNKIQDFKKKYRTVDVLIIDDIQFISKLENIQSEFFYTFNELYENRKQIIIASDRPPKDIPNLEARLRSRFETGLITDIAAPEFELKVAILKKKAEINNVDIPEDVIFFIATKIKNNIRQLDGVVQKIKAYHFVSPDIVPNIALAQSIIKDITNENEPIPIVIDKVFTHVSRDFNVSPEDMKSSKRTEQIVKARQVAMYILNRITSLSLSEIGSPFNRDHSTVHYSLSEIEKEINNSPSFSTRIDSIITEIKNN